MVQCVPTTTRATTVSAVIVVLTCHHGSKGPWWALAQVFVVLAGGGVLRASPAPHGGYYCPMDVVDAPPFMALKRQMRKRKKEKAAGTPRDPLAVRYFVTTAPILVVVVVRSGWPCAVGSCALSCAAVGSRGCWQVAVGAGE